MVESIPPLPSPIDPEKRREELAYLEGHDADIPTEDQSPQGAITHASKPHVDSDVEKRSDPADVSPTNSQISRDGEQDLATETDLEAGPRSDDTSLTKAENLVSEPQDPNIVWWSGPDDPENPLNWSERVKLGNVAVISMITFITPLASSMFAPGVPEVMLEFKSTNIQLASFVVSVYILGYGFGPFIIAPLSELYGRIPIYHACNVGFVIFTIACAVSTNLNMLIGFRFLEGCFGSAPLTLGGGSIADMIVQEKRGGMMAIWAMGPLLGPVVGPVAGGFLSQAKGWRWVFWLITIVAGAITLAAFVLLRETYPPTLLERKTKRLRKETGNQNLKSKLASELSPKALFKIAIVRPAKMLIFSPIVLVLSSFMAIVYGYLYLLFTTITEVFEQRYHFSQGAVGLTYLGIGLGMFCGLLGFGSVSDRLVKCMSRNGVMKPEYRLPPMIPGAACVPIGLFIYGWTADKHVFWIVPIIGTAFVGVGILATYMPISTYLVDAFTIHAASALAANAFLRSILGALLPLAGPKMYATLGLGWGNSLLAFVALAMCPITWLFYRYGERIRTSPKFQVKF